MISMKRHEEMAEEFQKAWNSHEKAALALLFCEDATFVNRFGHYVRGVQEIVSSMRRFTRQSTAIPRWRMRSLLR
jgi:uncharacterized protein (TIGR02246 family)